jgi:hypothetical protein
MEANLYSAGFSKDILIKMAVVWVVALCSLVEVY